MTTEADYVLNALHFIAGVDLACEEFGLRRAISVRPHSVGVYARGLAWEFTYNVGEVFLYDRTPPGVARQLDHFRRCCREIRDADDAAVRP